MPTNEPTKQLNPEYFVEWKVVQDSESNIDQIYINNQASDGWELVHYINSRQGRPYDRYYFKRIKINT